MHILLPTDFSDGSLNACAYALELFGSTGNSFTLLHTYFDPVPENAAMAGMSKALYDGSVDGMAYFLKRFRTLKNGADAEARTEVLYGPHTVVITDLCVERSVDITVMGTQGASGTPLFGTLAGEVSKSSKVPVLIVPKDARFTGLGRILLADDHKSVEPLAMRLLVRLARQHEAAITIAHVLRGAADAPDPHIIADYDATLSHVEHSYIGAPGDDVALTLNNVAERDKVDLVAVLHRHTGFLDSLFHKSTAKHLAMHSRIPLLVLEH